MSDKIQVSSTVLEVRQADIVEIGTEAIVNAANSDLEPGGGVCGAIYEAAGFETLDKLTQEIGWCEVGSAVITSAGDLPLPTRFIIHAVAPYYKADNYVECFELLGQAYHKALELADENKLSSIAFPSLGTGNHAFPIEKTAPSVLRTIRLYLQEHPQTSLRQIVFVVYTFWDLEVYRKALGK